MKISMDKQYQTRDGWKVTLYCVDAPGNYPVHGRVEFDNSWTQTSWTADGKLRADIDAPSSCDLIELPAMCEIDLWVNVYPTTETRAHDSLEEANENQAISERRIACLHIKRTVPLGYCDKE